MDFSNATILCLGDIMLDRFAYCDTERDPLWDRFIKNRTPIRDGIIEVPQRSGFGLELDWQQVEKYGLHR